jgi:hypothetical protein
MYIITTGVTWDQFPIVPSSAGFSNPKESVTLIGRNPSEIFEREKEEIK